MNSLLPALRSSSIDSTFALKFLNQVCSDEDFPDMFFKAVLPLARKCLDDFGPSNFPETSTIICYCHKLGLFSELREIINNITKLVPRSENDKLQHLLKFF